MRLRVPALACRFLVRQSHPSQWVRTQYTLTVEGQTLKPRVAELADKVLAGDRAALSRAITLVESTLPEDRVQSSLMLMRLLDITNQRRQKQLRQTYGKVGAHANLSAKRLHNTPSGTLRIGISGPPGVGKSTFIEALGTYLVTRAGQKVAVLPIDPSSARSGGSILGDKTRMVELSRLPNAYVRPSPSRGTLGGVAQDTAEAMILCEAAGYDVVLIETVGVGQSEVAVSDIVDMVILLVPPAGGDELQGIKKGIVELANLVVVNKADGDLLTTARMTRNDYSHACSLVPRQEGEWIPKVLLCSSVDPEFKYIEKIWANILEYEKYTMETGQLEEKRQHQRLEWMWRQLSDEVMYRIRRNPRVNEILEDIKERLVENKITSRIAASEVIDAFLRFSSSAAPTTTTSGSSTSGSSGAEAAKATS